MGGRGARPHEKFLPSEILDEILDTDPHGMERSTNLWLVIKDRPCEQQTRLLH